MPSSSIISSFTFLDTIATSSQPQSYTSLSQQPVRSYQRQHYRSTYPLVTMHLPDCTFHITRNRLWALSNFYPGSNHHESWFATRGEGMLDSSIISHVWNLLFDSQQFYVLRFLAKPFSYTRLPEDFLPAYTTIFIQDVSLHLIDKLKRLREAGLTYYR